MAGNDNPKCIGLGVHFMGLLWIPAWGLPGSGFGKPGRNQTCFHLKDKFWGAPGVSSFLLKGKGLGKKTFGVEGRALLRVQVWVWLSRHAGCPWLSRGLGAQSLVCVGKLKGLGPETRVAAPGKAGAAQLTPVFPQVRTRGEHSRNPQVSSSPSGVQTTLYLTFSAIFVGGVITTQMLSEKAGTCPRPHSWLRGGTHPGKTSPDS